MSIYDLGSCSSLVCSCLDEFTDSDLVELSPVFSEPLFTPSPEETELAVQIITNLAKSGMSYGKAVLLTVMYAYAIKKQFLPVHIWDGVQDEEMPVLNLVEKNSGTPALPADSGIKCCMSNSFAFGGCNASIIIKQD